MKASRIRAKVEIGLKKEQDFMPWTTESKHTEASLCKNATHFFLIAEPPREAMLTSRV